jgi:hypothetical protein
MSHCRLFSDLRAAESAEATPHVTESAMKRKQYRVTKKTAGTSAQAVQSDAVQIATNDALARLREYFDMTDVDGAPLRDRNAKRIVRKALDEIAAATERMSQR